MKSIVWDCEVANLESKMVLKTLNWASIQPYSSVTFENIKATGNGLFSVWAYTTHCFGNVSYGQDESMYFQPSQPYTGVVLQGFTPLPVFIAEETAFGGIG